MYILIWTVLYINRSVHQWFRNITTPHFLKSKINQQRQTNETFCIVFLITSGTFHFLYPDHLRNNFSWIAHFDSAYLKLEKSVFSSNLWVPIEEKMNRLAVSWSDRELYRYKKWEFGVKLVISNLGITSCYHVIYWLNW